MSQALLSDVELAPRIAAATLIRRFVNEGDWLDFDEAVDLIGREEANDWVRAFRYGCDGDGRALEGPRVNAAKGVSRGRDVVEPDGRRCKHCGRLLVPHSARYESRKNFERRDYCDAVCSTEGFRHSDAHRRRKAAQFKARLRQAARKEACRS